MSAEAMLHPQMADALARTAALQPAGVDRDALPIAEFAADLGRFLRELSDGTFPAGSRRPDK